MLIGWLSGRTVIMSSWFRWDFTIELQSKVFKELEVVKISWYMNYLMGEISQQWEASLIKKYVKKYSIIDI